MLLNLIVFNPWIYSVPGASVEEVAVKALVHYVVNPGVGMYHFKNPRWCENALRPGWSQFIVVSE